MRAYPPLPLAKTANIGCRKVPIDNLPKGYSVYRELGIVVSDTLCGSVVYRTENGSLFESRAIKTPGGDYLLLFPTNTLENPEGRSHFGKCTEKVNDFVAMRSSDYGETWNGPTRPIDIDYNLHGFVPLIPELSTNNPGTAVLNVNDDFVLGRKIAVIGSFSIDHIENCRPVFSKMVRVILILIYYIENLVCVVAGRSESEGSK